MLQITVGVFPGKVETIVAEDGMTVGEVLTLAGLTQGAEQDIKVDGEVANSSDTISSSTKMILLSKRIKGALDILSI